MFCTCSEQVFTFLRSELTALATYLMQLEFAENVPEVLHRVGCLLQQVSQETAKSDCDQVIFYSDMQSFRIAQKARKVALKAIKTMEFLTF